MDVWVRFKHNIEIEEKKRYFKTNNTALQFRLSWEDLGLFGFVCLASFFFSLLLCLPFSLSFSRLMFSFLLDITTGKIFDNSFYSVLFDFGYWNFSILEGPLLFVLFTYLYRVSCTAVLSLYKTYWKHANNPLLLFRNNNNDINTMC